MLRRRFDVHIRRTGWADVFRVRDSSRAALHAAIDLHADCQLPIGVALVLVAAAEEPCRIESSAHAITAAFFYDRFSGKYSVNGASSSGLNPKCT